MHQFSRRRIELAEVSWYSD